MCTLRAGAQHSTSTCPPGRRRHTHTHTSLGAHWETEPKTCDGQGLSSNMTEGWRPRSARPQHLTKVCGAKAISPTHVSGCASALDRTYTLCAGHTSQAHRCKHGARPKCCGHHGQDKRYDEAPCTCQAISTTPRHWPCLRSTHHESQKRCNRGLGMSSAHQLCDRKAHASRLGFPSVLGRRSRCNLRRQQLRSSDGW